MAVLIGPKDYPMQVNIRLVKSNGNWLVDASGDMLGQGPQQK